jgi:periplasmic divalent cation tolerance protein
MANERVVFVTVGGRNEAGALARALVGERLCACVNLIGVRSIYRWQGAVEESDEILCVMKTTRARFPALKKRVLELHSYQVPEVIALPIEDGSAPYLAWVRESVGPIRSIRSAKGSGARTRGAASRRRKA